MNAGNAGIRMLFIESESSPLEGVGGGFFKLSDIKKQSEMRDFLPLPPPKEDGEITELNI